MKTINNIYPYGIVPVVVLKSPDQAAPLAKTLLNAGLPVMEITFRTDAAEESIRIIGKEYPDILLGAGSVLSVDTARKAIEAGAQFIVSPGLNEEVVLYCQSCNIPVIPGVSTASEIEKALSLGLSVLKFFPAEAMGGTRTLKAFAGPYPNVSFIPTGGISENNISDYTKLDNVFACGATYIADKKALDEGNYDLIYNNAVNAIRKVHCFRMAHVGINTTSSQQAKDVADVFCDLFGFSREDGRISTFASKEIEVMYDDTYGSNGHLSFTANSIDRACRYLESKGVKLREDTLKYNDKGKIRFAYIEDEVNGFAIHIY